MYVCVCLYMKACMLSIYIYVCMYMCVYVGHLYILQDCELNCFRRTIVCVCMCVFMYVRIIYICLQIVHVLLCIHGVYVRTYVCMHVPLMHTPEKLQLYVFVCVYLCT
jgi:hypothetical protein